MVQPTRIRVLVGGDQPIVREGNVHVLKDGGLEVVGTSADARDLVRKARADRPDVVITDIQMPPDHIDEGLRAALEIRAAEPGVGVLVLSQFLEDRDAFDLVPVPSSARRQATNRIGTGAGGSCRPRPVRGHRGLGKGEALEAVVWLTGAPGLLPCVTTWCLP
jgi:CheY-like chemotaxis protein